MIIQHQPCPSCHIRRTVSAYRCSHCFNCRHQWAKVVCSLSYAFTERELARLIMYRNAIRAGIYSDWPAFA